MITLMKFLFSFENNILNLIQFISKLLQIQYLPKENFILNTLLLLKIIY